MPWVFSLKQSFEACAAQLTAHSRGKLGARLPPDTASSRGVLQLFLRAETCRGNCKPSFCPSAETGGGAAQRPRSAGLGKQQKKPVQLWEPKSIKCHLNSISLIPPKKRCLKARGFDCGAGPKLLNKVSNYE